MPWTRHTSKAGDRARDEIERLPVSEGRKTRARVPFATTSYEPDEDGYLRPMLPMRCAFAVGTKMCSVFVDHYRPRRTGPGFPLAVVGCSAHPHGRYTLYPPGHVPYGRAPVVPYSPRGMPLLDGTTGQLPWEDTLFGAAVDAARGEEYTGDGPSGDARTRRTQRRRLEVAGRLMGVHPEVDDSARERIAARLGVPTMTLRTASRLWAADWTARGTAVLAVLLAITVDGAVLDRMLAAGAVSGLWAPPRRSRATRRTSSMPRSGLPERPTARSPRGRSPPPTTLSGATRAGAARISEP